MSNELTKAAKVVCTLSAIALIMAIPDWQYDYYEILRWLVFLSSLVVLYWYYTAEAGSKVAWMLLFTISVVLFNPITKVLLDKPTWVVIDMATAVLFIAALISIWRRSSLGRKRAAAEVEIFLSEDGESIKISNDSSKPLRADSIVLNGTFKIPSFEITANEALVVHLDKFLNSNGARFDTRKFGIKRIMIKGRLGKQTVEIVFGDNS